MQYFENRFSVIFYFKFCQYIDFKSIPIADTKGLIRIFVPLQKSHYLLDLSIF